MDISADNHPFHKLVFVNGSSAVIEYGYFECPVENEQDVVQVLSGPMVQITVERMTLMELEITWKDATLEKFFVGIDRSKSKKRKNRIALMLDPEMQELDQDRFGATFDASYRGGTVTLGVLIKKE